jgi:hypothetical protein
MPVALDLFRFDDPRAAAAWQAVDDRVMGGVSRSRMRADPAGHALFEGLLSLESGGGFASVRAAASLPPSAAPRAWLLEARGDGRRYKFNLRAAGRFDDVNYQAAFEPPSDAWQVVRLAHGDFIPTFRGRRVDAPPLDHSLVGTLGLMVADRQAGTFALALRRIAFETD